MTTRPAKLGSMTSSDTHIAEAASVVLARNLVAILVGAGVRHWFYSPGSRNAPLGYALADLAAAGDIELTVRIDERDAAFMALGAAKTDVLAAVVMTSGTAVGNALPAVMEASHAGVPLIVLSADRPVRLRGSGANQTTWQPGIFANFVRFEADIDSEANLEASLECLLSAARGENQGEAKTGAAFPCDPGPVHLNVCFDEPLTPAAVRTVGGNAAPTGKSKPRLHAPRSRGTVLVVGSFPGKSFPDEPQLWREVAAKRIPVCSEPGAGKWREHPNAVRCYSNIMTDQDWFEAIDRAVVIGRPTLTRPITRLIQSEKAEFFEIAGQRVNLDDAEHPRWHSAAALSQSLAPHAGEWLDEWRSTGETLAENLVSEWGMYQACADIWESGSDLFLGASLTIRAFDAVAGTSEKPGRVVFANRGLAGIDGTLASAWGVALACGKALRVVLGDVSYCHDLGQLNLGTTETVPDLQIVVLDNHGGRIFADLEHGAAPEEVLKRMFLTEQRAVNETLGWQCFTARNRDELRALLEVPIRGVSVLRVQCGVG